MQKIMNYIDSALTELPDNKSVYKFKMKLIEEVTERANEITHAGIDDENVIADLIISEHENIKGEYYALLDAENTKKKIRTNRVAKITGSLVYFLAVIFGYLAVSFISDDWNHTWVYLVSGVLIYGIYALISVVKKLTARSSMFHPVSRILIAVSVFMLATSVFLHLMVIFKVPNAWLTFIFGVLLMFSADGIYVELVSERLAIIFHLLYIVPASAMFYIILCVTNIMPWHPGWIIIPSSLIIVFFIITIRIIKHNKTKSAEMEDDSEWKES